MGYRPSILKKRLGLELGKSRARKRLSARFHTIPRLVARFYDDSTKNDPAYASDRFPKVGSYSRAILRFESRL
jgi:hypothetical protein